MRLVIALVILAAGAPLPALAEGKWDPAQTEMDCRPYEQMAADLLSRFNERPVGIGLVGAPENGIRLMLFVGPHGKSFSVVAVRAADDEACMGNFGTDWVTGSAIQRLLDAPVPLPPAKDATP